jgi:hypothetical protein
MQMHRLPRFDRDYMNRAMELTNTKRSDLPENGQF